MTHSSVPVPLELFNLYRDIEDSLCHRDRFKLRAVLESRLEQYINYKIQCSQVSLDPVDRLFRARTFAFRQSEIHEPSQLGAPPPELARAGRLNPEGLPILYLAESHTAAISEVRPWVGAKLSVAVFRPKRVLSVVSLAIGIEQIQSGSAAQHPEGFLMALAIDLNHISAPGHPDDRLSYLPTQYIASRFRQHQIDGLLYSSALCAGGVNYAIFDPNTCRFESASVFEVSSVEIEARAA